MFSAMDMDRSGTLSAKEVQALLAKDSRWRIEPREDCVKMLMNIFDTDRSGNINFVEFEGLYRYIKVSRVDNSAPGRIATPMERNNPD